MPPLLYLPFAGAAGAALSPAWTARLGAFDLDGAGHARGKTLAADGNELVVNGGMELDSDWPNYFSVVANERSAAQAHGGVYSRHLVLDVLGHGTYQNMPGLLVKGVTYQYGAWFYLVSGDCRVWFDDAATTKLLTTGIWTQRSGTKIFVGNARIMLQSVDAMTAEFYGDDASVQATYALATVNPGTPRVELRPVIVIPAAGSVPFGLVARYLDPSNYWLWRITPNTASGNDFELVQMQSGAMTARAAARVAWAAGQTYNLTLKSSATNVYTALVNGAQVLNYADAGGFNADKTLFGLLHAGTTAPFGTLEVYGL